MFGKKKKLLEWQNAILEEPTDKLIMTEKQLKETTNLMVENDIRIIQDCIRLIENTVNPETYFSRFQLMLERTSHLVKIEKYVDFSGTLPSIAVKEIEMNKDISDFEFCKRYYSQMCIKISNLKTQKGKDNRIMKYFADIEPYLPRMNDENASYIRERMTPLTRV